MVRYIYQKSTKTFEKIPEYIYQRSNGWFEIRKRIGGTLIYWGSFPTLEEARLYRAYYIGKHWLVNPSFKNNKFIRRRNNRFIISKRIEGRRIVFGTFQSLSAARNERDICLICNWDINQIVEFDESDYCWLDQQIEA